jgi:hypothetical protein
MIISSGWFGACGAAGCIQGAEVTPERQMLFLRQVLVAEEDHAVFGQRPVDFIQLMIGQRRRQIHPADLRPDDRRQLVDADRLIRGWIIRQVTIPGAVIAAQRIHA